MNLIIIACCKTKKLGGYHHYGSSPLGDYLGESKFRKLMAARRELASILNLRPGPDLGFDNRKSSTEFMPFEDTMELFTKAVISKMLTHKRNQKRLS